MTERVRTSRPIVSGRRGAIASGHPLASEAGMEMLRRGGSGADAAVAVAATLAVVEPNMSGLGGDGFFLVRSPDGSAEVINASGPAPLAATAESFGDSMPRRGAASASTPGLVDGWWALHQRHGRLPWSDLFGSAIACARDGFPATQRLCAFVAADQADLLADPVAASVFAPDGRLPRVGDLVRQSALAHSLELIAAHGRGAMYGDGPLGRALIDYCATHAGFLAREDFDTFASELQSPIQTSYRGYTVLEAPPNSTGHVLLQELNMAECIDLRAMGFLSADHVHALVEIKKLAFADREAYSADPRSFDVPLGELLSKERAQRQVREIDMRRAAERSLAPGIVGSGDDTTYFAVVDGGGMALSCIQSLNQSWGAAVIEPTTGILLNNRMFYWHLAPGHPNRLEPGKRVRHTMNPPMVLRGDDLFLVFGTPGADQQVQVNLQVLTGFIDFDLDPQEAVEMARWRSFQPGGESDWPHGTSSALVIENRMPSATLTELARRGHELEIVGPLEGGCNVQAIQVHPDHGTLLAASDPRRDGYALAF